MHIWLELILREVLFFALLLALGCGPAAFLPQRFGNTVRLALAAALGLCVGICLTDTLVYFFPAHQTGLVLVVAAVGSIAVAVWRRPAIGAPSLRRVVEVATVVVVVLGAFSYPLAAHHTVGPAGGYQIGDAGGYIDETDSEQHVSIHQVEREKPPFAVLSTQYWATYAAGDQQLDVSALEANVNSLLGLGSTDTYSPFLIAILLVGALGAYAAVLSTGAAGMGAVLAGCLFTGAVFTELFMDGSQGALTGAALLAPLVVVGWEALKRRQTASLVLLALLAAGLATLYPLYVPCVVIGGLATVGVMTVRRLRRGRPARREVLVAAAQVLGVLVLASVFTPVAFLRDLRYWTAILNGGQPLSELPIYYLPVSVIPGWVLQTRDFYGLVNLGQANLSVLLQGGAVPALLIGLIAVGAWRYRLARVMLAVAAGAALLAYYTAAGQNCSYCVQRNMIPVAVLAVPAVALGVAAVATLRFRGATAIAALSAAVIVVIAGHESVVEHQRLANSSYLLDPEVRQSIAALPARAGPVELEGFTAQGPRAPEEQADVYLVVEEKTGDASLPTTGNDNSGLFYLGGPAPLGPSFRSNYQYVLTRLAGVATQRETVARHGAIALERRTRELDVTITSGVSVASAHQDPSGTAWVKGPMQFLVVGGKPAQPAFISLVYDRTVPVTVLRSPSVATIHPSAHTLAVCLRTEGSPPVRTAGLKLSFVAQPAPPPAARFANRLPARGVRLASMSVGSTPCAPPR